MCCFWIQDEKSPDQRVVDLLPSDPVNGNSVYIINTYRRARNVEIPSRILISSLVGRRMRHGAGCTL